MSKLISEQLQKYLDTDYDLNFVKGNCISWHLGYYNTIDYGIKQFLVYLKNNNLILLEEPEIISYLNYGGVVHVLIAQALPRLEYLEYMANKQFKAEKEQ